MAIVVGLQSAVCQVPHLTHAREEVHSHLKEYLYIVLGYVYKLREDYEMPVPNHYVSYTSCHSS